MAGFVLLVSGQMLDPILLAGRSRVSRGYNNPRTDVDCHDFLLRPTLTFIFFLLVHTRRVQYTHPLLRSSSPSTFLAYPVLGVSYLVVYDWLSNLFARTKR